MAFIAAVVAFLKALYPDIPEDAVKYVLYACLGYATIEGAVDAVCALGQWLAKRHASKHPDDEQEAPAR